MINVFVKKQEQLNLFLNQYESLVKARVDYEDYSIKDKVKTFILYAKEWNKLTIPFKSAVDYIKSDIPIDVSLVGITLFDADLAEEHEKQVKFFNNLLLNGYIPSDVWKEHREWIVANCTPLAVEWFTRKERVRELYCRVTTRKKLNVLECNWDGQYKWHPTHEYITPPTNVDTSTWFKGQILEIRLYLDNDWLFVDNAQPRKYCCENMKYQFGLFSYLGWGTSEHFITHDKGMYSINSVGSSTGDGRDYAICNCPFCGTKLGDYNGKFIKV